MCAKIGSLKEEGGNGASSDELLTGPFPDAPISASLPKYRLRNFAELDAHNSNRKTAIVSACSEPLLAWEEEQAKRIEPEIKGLKSEKQTIERAIEGRRTKGVKARGLTGIQQLQAEINEFETHIPNIPKTQKITDRISQGKSELQSID